MIITHMSDVNKHNPPTKDDEFDERSIEFWEYLAREIPEKYLYGSKECPVCMGHGIVFDPQGGGWSTGALRLCRCVEGITKCDGKPPYEYYDPESDLVTDCPSRQAREALEKIRLIQRSSGIPERYRDHYIPSILNPENYISLNLAISSAVHIIKEFGHGTNRGLYLHGGTGTGKTLTGCVILNELVRLYQIKVVYAKVTRDILGKIRASFNPKSEHFGEGYKIEQRLARVPVLMIDDFGSHKDTEWVNEVLYDLIDARYENNLLTIITSNDHLDTWKEIGSGRIYSRLVEMSEEIHIDVPDFRLFRS